MAGFLGAAVLLLAATPLVVSQKYAGTGYGTGHSNKYYFDTAPIYQYK